MMYLGIPSIIWTIVYITAALWLTMRILAVVVQFVIRRKTGVLVKIDRVGFFAFYKIHIGIKNGLSVEVDKVWLSSCIVNDEIRQPLVVCMGEVRIQANTLGPRDRNSAHLHPAPRPPTRQFALPKLATYLQHFGIRIQSLTVMLLKTMIADCLIHLEGQDLGLDISCIEDCLQLIIKAGSVNCRALRSVPQTDAQSEATEPCLAETSFSLYVDLSVYRNNIKRVKGSRVLVNKPQMMLTEGLLSGAHYIQDSIQPEATQVPEQATAETSTVVKPSFLDMLPQELGIDFTDVTVKIVRETKQRSLSIGIKTFHVDMFNERSSDTSQEIVCTLLIKEFQTKSQQARFAELVDLDLTAMLQGDKISVKLTSQSAYLHYHHEEVQYWIQVISQLTQRERAMVANTETNFNTTQTQSRSGLLQFIYDKQLKVDLSLLDISAAFSTASCTGLVLGVQRVSHQMALKHGLHGRGTDLLSWIRSRDLTCELEVDTLYCTHLDAQVPVADLGGKKHYWNHVVYMNILIIKAKKLGVEWRIEGMQDHLHLEWSSVTTSFLISMVLALEKAKISAARRISNAALRPVSSLNIPVSADDRGQELMVSVKFDVSNTNVFVCNNYNVGLMLRLDTASLGYRCSQANVTLEGLKLAYVTISDKYITLVRSVDLDQSAASIKEIRIRYKKTSKEGTIQVSKEVKLDWTTACHMCIIQVLEDFAELKNKLGSEAMPTNPVGQTRLHAPKSRVKQNIKLSVTMMVTTQTLLHLHLSSKHSVTLCADSLFMSLTPGEVTTEIDNLDIFCDDEKVFRFEGLIFGTLPDAHLKDERDMVKSLTLPTHRAWNVCMKVMSVVFPYSFDFATVFEEFVNFFKWLKLVHKRKRKSFTVDSKLPPDLQIKAEAFRLEIQDDPFEVKLGDNHELMRDEYSEGEKRRAMLDQKVKNLKKGYGIIPAHKLDEIYESLAKSSCDIYMQRSRQLYQITPPRTQLFTWNMDSVEIIALADTSIHGKDNVVANMRDIDPDSPYPEDGLDFVTLWCRHVNVGLHSWTFSFRDYPLPAMNIKDMNIYGRLIGAEVEGAKRAKRSCVVEVAAPWGDTTVERNLPALKFFHDFRSDMEQFDMAYGSCWEPVSAQYNLALDLTVKSMPITDMEQFDIAYGSCWEPVSAQYNLALDLINNPSVDPSRPLPWWDKSRLLFHGRLIMMVGKMSWLYHASLDPYNTTELMDWTWSNLLLDWTNMKFDLKGDLDIYARTASKYDDCKLLHLPSLRFCAEIEWLCLGDHNDHHAVMPCAPDKVPDYSQEQHDSFRAFRSQNLNLSISLETTPKSKESSRKGHPSCLFYASTLRYMEKIWMCIVGVTRPTRRGPLFNRTKPRKPILSRHYKYASMSVNIHHFEVCYWMSFAMQHGAKFSGNSFTMEVRDELAMRPIDDGLIHRPNADWSVNYLNCELLATKIWLCSSKLKNEDELDVSATSKPVADSYFLSVAKLSYQRSSTDKPGTEEHTDKQTSQTLKPTHNLHVYEMRGLWNKKNRTILLGLYDGYAKAQALRRNLSSDALKGFKVEGGSTPNSKLSQKGSHLNPEPQSAATPSPSTKIQTGHAYSMLKKLVAESDSKSVAFTEEPSSSNMDQLHGVAACTKDDILQKNWHIELHNSQMIVKGCETQGFVIIGMAKAKILSCAHKPVWVNSQLRSKDTWTGSVECMQYYATVDPGPEFCDDNLPWLSKKHVEDWSEPDPSSIQEMAGSGHSVGGILSLTISSERSQSKSVQLQRIISRCKCQFFYANFGEVDVDMLPEVPRPPSEDSDMLTQEEGVDTLTLLHYDLNVCSNHLQYMMILDIVNNLLLHVETTKKEATEKLQSMRFQLQLSRVEDQKTPILSIQENVRRQMEKLRHYERELFLLEDEDEPCSSSMELFQETLEGKLLACKERVNSLNEELSIRISCFKESQLQDKAQLQTKQTHQAHVVKRNEVCFKFAQWRLTEVDGQVGIADLALRNFVYTKVNRDNDTWSHQLELGWVKMTNLIPNTIYKDVLVPRDPLGKDDNRKMAMRLLCTERPPVGGIAVKEHFEVNVVPLQIQLTYQLYKKIMGFFFPGKNIDNEDQQDDELVGATASKSGTAKKSSQKKDIKRSPSLNATDDIHKMKERAAYNNSFLYFKIPEVSLRVSYKGEKPKNIEDVHDFSLVLPTLEYHNKIWTWFDLLMAMKADSKRVLIAQAIKQKLHIRNKLHMDDTPVTDVQQEEDKAKMLLGARLLSGQEKPRKTLFGKFKTKDDSPSPR